MCYLPDRMSKVSDAFEGKDFTVACLLKFMP